MKELVFVVSGKSPVTMPGGLGAYSFNSAKIFKDLGYDVHIIGFSKKEETISLEEDITLHHVTTAYSRLLGIGAFFINQVFVKKMLSVCDAKRPAKVYVFGAGIWGASGVSLKTQLAKQGIPVISMVGYFTTYKHEYEGHLKGVNVQDYGLITYLGIWSLSMIARIFFQPAEHRMFRLCDTIVVHYNSTRNIIANEVRRLNADKIKKIPYYVELFDRQSQSFSENGRVNVELPTVSVICRQDPRKGINTFIHAVKILRDRGVRFNCVIAGSGVFLDKHKQLANKIGLSDFISFLGFVPSVEKLLDETDVYVLPSVEEGSGAISLLEAMKKGVAIVTTKCDGIPEDFTQGKTGMLVEPGDSQGMADALEKVIRDKGFRESLADNVRADYVQRFSFEKMKLGISSLMSERA